MMTKLALNGGAKTVTRNYLEEATLPVCSEKGKALVNQLMEKGEISQSPLVARFAQRFSSYVGTTYGLCTNNGTSAIESALFAVGVAPQDEVIVPSYTFWASVTPIIAQHGIPIFCEVDPDTHCIDPKDIERHITPRTKAILVVHVWGNPCDMDAIMKIAHAHHLAVVEDCSHAHGASYKGRMVGSIGDVGCYSLQGTKTLPAGEGGILVTDHREYYERAAALGHYELVPEFPEDSPYRKHALTGMGAKFRIHPFAAALADSQLDELNSRSELRRRNAKRFEEALADIPFIKPQQEYPGGNRVFSYHYYRYLPRTNNPTETYVFLKALKAEGIPCGYCGYGRLHTAPLFVEGGPYGDCSPGKERINPSLPVTEMMAKTTFLAAPRFETSCDPLIDQYSAAYHKVAEHMDEVIAHMETHDYSKELQSLSGRSIAML
jgi:dTDP-4-amino-4,6-dideoxygalactose transaminase